MQPSLQITVRDIPTSDAIENNVRHHAEKLSHIFDHILSCKVVIDIDQNHKHQGKLFRVHLHLFVPRKELAVTRIVNEDLYVAIRDAFRALRRQLEAYADKLHGHTKIHQPALYGQVSRLFVGDQYGFITTPDGAEFYFHANTVTHPNFEQLHLGDGVHFLESFGGDGLQAVNVCMLSR